MHSRNLLTGNGKYGQDVGDSRTQQQPCRRGRFPAAKRAPAHREPAVKIFEGCVNEVRKNDSSPVKCLQEYCKRMNLEQPKYKTIPIGREDGKNVFNCKIQVGDVSGQDPCARDETAEKAQDHAAAILLDKLNVKFSSTCSLRQQDLTSFSDWETIMQRIYKITTKNGLWKTSVESTYEVNFNERLPPNWFQFAKGCDYFELPSPNVEILALAQIPVLPPINVSVVKGEKLVSLKVTFVESLDRVWVIMDSDELIKMNQELKAAVSKGVIQFGMFLLRENTYCLARVNGELLRVKVKSSDLKSATCLLIDNGATASIPLSDLTLLPCKGWKLPPQVVNFGLQGVRNLPIKSHEALQFVQNFLQGFEKLDAFVEEAVESNRMELLLITHDKDQLKPINSILIYQLATKFLTPDLPPPCSAAGLVAVSHVPEDIPNCVFVQPQPQVAEWLQNELQDACYENLLHEQSCPKTVPSNLYLVMLPDEVRKNCFRPWTYHRVLMRSKRMVGICMWVKVLFVDTGVTNTVFEHKMRNFPADYHIALETVPLQAVQCEIGNSSSNSLSAEQVQQTLPLKTIVQLSTIAPKSEGQAPRVSIELIV